MPWAFLVDFKNHKKYFSPGFIGVGVRLPELHPNLARYTRKVSISLG